MIVKDDMSIEVAADSLKLPFNNRQYNLIAWKRYKGTLYSFCNDRNKLWRYEDKEWK